MNGRRPPTRQFVLVGLVSLSILLAGCGAFNPGDGTTTQTTTETTSTTATTTPTRTTTTTTTSTRPGFGNIEHELIVENDGNRTITVTINISATNATAFTTDVQLDPGEERAYNVTYPHAGNYTITVTTANTTATTTREFPAGDPNGLLEVTITDTQAIRFAYLVP